VSSRDAVDFLLGLATREDTRAGEAAILPLTLADSVTVWPMLLKLARDDHAPTRTRRQSVFWLGQAAGDAATRDLADLVDDGDLDRDVKEQAVFALSQRGLAPVVLVTGGVGSGDTVSESDVGRRYLLKAGLPDGAVVGLPAGASTSASLDGVAHWFAGKENRRVLLVSDGFHMLRLRIIATRLGLLPFTSPAPNSPIRSNPRRNAAYFLAEGFKVPVTWLFNH